MNTVKIILTLISLVAISECQMGVTHKRIRINRIFRVTIPSMDEATKKPVMRTKPAKRQKITTTTTTEVTSTTEIQTTTTEATTTEQKETTTEMETTKWSPPEMTTMSWTKGSWSTPEWTKSSWSSPEWTTESWSPKPMEGSMSGSMPSRKPMHESVSINAKESKSPNNMPSYPSMTG